MIVIDAGAWAMALVDDGDTGQACRTALANDDEWVAPEHAALETLRTIRRFESAGYINEVQAGVHVQAVIDASIRYVGAEPWVLQGVWRLRHTISPYDAPYVVVALAMELPMVTIDHRLGRAARAVGVEVRVPTE